MGYLCQIGAFGVDFDRIVADFDILRPPLERDHKEAFRIEILAVAIFIVARKVDIALLGKLPGDRPRLAQAAIGACKDAAQFGNGAVAIVGQAVDQDRNAMWAIPFIDNLFNFGSIFFQPSPTADGAIDIVLGHIFGAGFIHGQP